MIIWLIELVLLIVVMRFIEEIGLWGSCVCFAVLQVINAAILQATFSALFSAFINGIIMGFLAYLLAKFFLFLIRVLGTIGSFLIGLFFILAFLAIVL
jgi:hypothetical protein